jgi:type I restriction enzyme S subunit
MKHAAQPWSSDRLKDVAFINRSSLPAGTDPDYTFAYLDISNVNYHGIIERLAIERLRFEDAPSRARRRAAHASTVVSSVRPNLQAVAFLDDIPTDLICSTGFNVVEAKQNKHLSKFLYYVLISDGARQHFEATAKGVGYPAVDDADFGALHVPLVSLPEQQQIVDYLDAACAAVDAAVEAKRQQLDTLAAVKASMVECAVNVGLDPHVELVTINRDWIQSLPLQWTPVRVKRVVSRIDYGISESTERDGRYPVLKMGNIQDGELVFTKMEGVDEVIDDLILEHNDLLYTRTNSPDQVGKAALFRGSKADGITFASYLVRLRVSHRVLPGFLNYVVNSRSFLAFARKLAIPSVQQSNLNSTRYGQMLIPLPPIPEQVAIVQYLDRKLTDLARVAATIDKQIDTLLAYRKSLIHECVTGQRRVGDRSAERVLAHG